MGFFLFKLIDFFYCAITRSIRSRITSNRALMLRSPVKTFGEKLFVIMSRRPRTESSFAYAELFFLGLKRGREGSSIVICDEQWVKV